MEEAPITALLVEDDEDEVLLLTEAIRDAGADYISIIHAEARAGAMEILRSRSVDAVLLDLSLPDSSGVEGVKALVEAAGEAPVIVCTGLNDQSIAQAAIRAGAQDYLVKNPKLYGAVPRILRHTVERCRIIAASNKKILQAHQYTELLLTKVISVADSGLGITDHRGLFQVVNPALADLRGCAILELVGRPWTDLLPAKSRDAELVAYLSSLNSGTDYERERLKIEHVDGSTIEVSLRSVHLRLGDSNPCRVLSFSNPERTKPTVDSSNHNADFAETLKHRVADKPAELATGRVMVMGLQKLKDELGDRWDQVAGSVQEIAEQAISKHLSPGDTFTLTPTRDYLICFGQADQKQAAGKIEAIVRVVRQKILASGTDGDSTVRSLAPEVRSQLADVKSETHTIQVSPSEVEESAVIPDVIAEKINASVERAKAATNQMLADLHTQCRAKVREVHTRERGAATLAMHDLDPDSRRLRQQLVKLANSDPTILAEIDIIVLGNAAQKIYDLGAVKSPLIAVDVHYSTLQDRRLCDKYISVCQTLDGIATRSLVFNVKGISIDTNSKRVGAILSSLEPFSRFRMMEVKKPVLGGLDLKEANIALVALAYGDIMNSFYRDPSKSKRFIRDVHLKGARIVIDRVTAVDGGHLFKDFNVDFVSYEPSTARVA